MFRQALYKFSADKCYTNSLVQCVRTHEVNLPVVYEDKDRSQITHKKNYDLNIGPGEEWITSTAIEWRMTCIYSGTNNYLRAWRQHDGYT